MIRKKRKPSNLFKTKVGALTLLLWALVFFIGDIFTGIIKDFLDKFLPPNQTLVARVILFIVLLILFGYIYSKIMDAEKRVKK